MQENCKNEKDVHMTSIYWNSRKSPQAKYLPFRSGVLSTFVLFNLLIISLTRFSTLIVRTLKKQISVRYIIITLQPYLSSFLVCTTKIFLRDEEAHHLRIVETNLTNIHGGSFLQVGPRSVHNIDVVHLVAWHIIPDTSR